MRNRGIVGSLAALFSALLAREVVWATVPPEETLQENEVLLVYYSEDPESLGIKNHYISKYQNVITFDLHG